MLKSFDIKENILLKIKAGAKQNSIDGFIEIDSKQYLKISIKAQAERGKANQMIIEFLAKQANIKFSMT